MDSNPLAIDLARTQVTEAEAVAAAGEEASAVKAMKNVKRRHVMGRYAGQNGPVEGVLATIDTDMEVLQEMLEASRELSEDITVDPLVRSREHQVMVSLFGERRKLNEIKLKLLEMVQNGSRQLREEEKPRNKPPVLVG